MNAPKLERYFGWHPTNIRFAPQQQFRWSNVMEHPSQLISFVYFSYQLCELDKPSYDCLSAY
jgi:hypothetical protein